MIFSCIGLTLVSIGMTRVGRKDGKYWNIAAVIFCAIGLICTFGGIC